MPNREKVIKGLECCTFILGKRKCNECPYQKDNGCYQLQDDFHALLKEQEPMEPIYQERSEEHVCQKCGRIVWKDDGYCSKCGQRIKWK